jgi:peroxiredoxin
VPDSPMESGGKFLYLAAAAAVALGITIFVLLRAFAPPSPSRPGASGADTAGQTDSVPAVPAGERAPDFTLPSLSGQEVSMAKLRGKVIILNVWATWCEPCRAEMPSMETLYEDFKSNKNFVLLAVSQDERGREAVAPFIKKNGYHFTVLLDPKNLVSSAYGASGVPETFVIGRDGRIVAHHLGAFDWSRSDVRDALKELLNSKTG